MFGTQDFRADFDQYFGADSRNQTNFGLSRVHLMFFVILFLAMFFMTDNLTVQHLYHYHATSIK